MPADIILTQLHVFIIVVFFFFLGAWSSGRLCASDTFKKSDFIAFSVAGFFLLGLPLSPAVYAVLSNVDNNIFLSASALVPTFFAGFTARGELRRIVLEMAKKSGDPA